MALDRKKQWQSVMNNLRMAYCQLNEYAEERDSIIALLAIEKLGLAIEEWKRERPR